MTPLSHDAITDALADLDGWHYTDDKLQKSFTFGDFKEAMSFIVRLGFHAEAQNHHPELFNVYNRVDVALNTHDAGNQVTERDLKLARTIEDFSWT